MNTKLGTKVNMYLEWENKSQQITNFKKKLTNTKKNHKIHKKNTIFSLIHCLTYLYNTSFIHSLSAYYLIVSSHDNDFVI